MRSTRRASGDEPSDAAASLEGPPARPIVATRPSASWRGPGRARRAGVAAPLLAALLIGCGAKMPGDVGLGPLAPCPSTPNCVSSVEPRASDAWVEPLTLVGPPDRAWRAVREELESWRRVRIAAATDEAIHAEATSAIFRFEDDLELRLRAGEGRIDVRSASRIGRSDLGANRRRVERLREALVERGVVAPAETAWEEAP